MARRSDGAVGPPRVVAQEPELVGVTHHPVVAASDNGHGAVERNVGVLVGERVPRSVSQRVQVLLGRLGPRG